MSQVRLILMIGAVLAIGVPKSAAQEIPHSTRPGSHPDCVHQPWMPIALPDSTGVMNFVDATGRRIPVTNVDYRREFAAGTLMPDRVVLGDHTIRTGQSEPSILDALGFDYREVESPTWRSQLRDAEFIGDLMVAHPVTMHFYILADLQVNSAEGWFKVLEWTFPRWGTLRVYFSASTESGPFKVRLFEVEPNSLGLEDITWAGGEHLRLSRAGSPAMLWDIDQNSLTIK